MEPNTRNIPYRSVRLIQRGDWEQLRSQSAAAQSDAVSSVPDTDRWATPVRQEESSRDRRWEDANEESIEEVRERRQERRERRSSREGDRGRKQGRSSSRKSFVRERIASIGGTALARDGARLRELREREDAPEFGNSRLPDHEVASAYVGESGVVGVSRRSERRSRFTLVPRESERSESLRSYDEPQQREEARTYQRFSHDEYELSNDYDVQEFGLDEDDFVPRGLSGAQSRRQAVAAGLATIPQAIGSIFGAIGGWFGRLFVSHVRGVLAIITMALLVLMLFTPVRNLYVAHRQLDRLQQTYDALLAENEQVRAELEELQTREGIENEARERGYVEVGETKVIVEGLPEEESTDLSDTIGEVEVTETPEWYTRLFDLLFGYDPEA